jgi:peptidoglycan/xylan/chitin deacetylase (PgdA/CDA1 family)
MDFIKKGVVKALSWRLLVQSSRRFVFLYHDVSDPGEAHHSRFYSTNVATFRQQIEFLARNFRLLPLDEILSPELDTSREHCAAITFDDGFLSVKETATPYLLTKGIPFMVFLNRLAVTENRLFNDSEDAKLERGKGVKVFLNEDDVRSLSCAGVDVGSHSATHRRLVDCDDQMLCEEIEGNKLYLEQLTGQSVRHLALPFGKREHYTEHVLEHCRQAGHEFVFSTNPTFFDSSSACYQRRLIPRIGLANETPAELTFMINRPLFKPIDI